MQYSADLYGLGMLALHKKPAGERTFSADGPGIQAFNWKVSGVAVGVIVATAIAIFFCRRYIRAWAELWWLLLALACASSFLVLSPSAFLWRHLPKLRFLQFPWRWLIPLDFA